MIVPTATITRRSINSVATIVDKPRKSLLFTIDIIKEKGYLKLAITDIPALKRLIYIFH